MGGESGTLASSARGGTGGGADICADVCEAAPRGRYEANQPLEELEWSEHDLGASVRRRLWYPTFGGQPIDEPRLWRVEGDDIAGGVEALQSKGRMTPDQDDIDLSACREPNPRLYREETMSAEDLAAIEHSVFQCQPGIIYVYELTYQNSYTIGLLRKRIREESSTLERYVYLVDLTRANRPNAEVREHLKAFFLDPELAYTVVLIKGSLFLKVAARFVFSGILAKDAFTIVSDRSEAIARARAELYHVG